MSEQLRTGAPASPESTEKQKPVEVNFFKLGGTWDMIFRDNQKIGTGNLDDDALKEMQIKMGCFSGDEQGEIAAYREFSLELYARFQSTAAAEKDVGEHLSSWAHATNMSMPKRGIRDLQRALRAGEHTVSDYIVPEDIKNLIRGPFIPLFSGDSSHLENEITAPMVATLLQRSIREPHKPLVGGQGTDTADMALLQLYDVFTYDTDLPSLILAGANRSHVEFASDAPRNFVHAAKLANRDLPPGGYWVFQENLYSASDVVKIDPLEDRPIEGQTTFHSPHQKNVSILSALKQYGPAQWDARKAPSPEHVIHKVTAENLYDALESIYNPDLGKKDSVSATLRPGIRNPKHKAVVISTHSLGNTSNGIRDVCIKEAYGGKLIVGISRTLISATNEEYAASLFGVNQNPRELGGTGKMVIYGHKLNSSVANALIVRALIEKLDQTQTQELFTQYAQSRGLVQVLPRRG